MNAQEIARFDADAAKFADGLIKACGRFNINTALRRQHFLAQLGHESGGFRHLSENLNYRAETLMRLWPRRFPSLEIAEQYAHQPERIANRVYCDRMGNGPESSGEGWLYRGRGLIQLTGKDNYRQASLALYHDERLVNVPDVVATPDIACLTAAWYWHSRNLNSAADRDDINAVTFGINGGYNGLEDRREWLERAKAHIS